MSLTPAAQAPELPVHTIAPAIGWVPIRLGEIWEFRELLFFLVWREVKIRYKDGKIEFLKGERRVAYLKLTGDDRAI